MVVWLRGVLDELEATARRAGSVADHADLFVESVGADLVIGREAVLADITAKRAIIDLHVPDSFGNCVICGWDDGYAQEPVIHDPHPCDTIRLLASASAHCSGYRDAWRPQTTESGPRPTASG